jgi:RNA polymerase sigma-70 factor (ECF subfamily)
MSAKPTDEELALEYRATGRESLYAELFLRNRETVLRMCRRFLQNPEAAEDAAQGVFLKVFRHRGRFDGGSFKAWLAVMTRRTCINEIQRWKRRGWGRILPLDELMPGLGRAPDGMLWLQIAEVLEQMPNAEQRVCLKLRYFEGLSHEEIAQRLRVSLKDVKTRVQNGCMQFRKRWKGRAGGQAS